MLTTDLNNIVPSFYETIFIPIAIFTILAQFLDSFAHHMHDMDIIDPPSLHQLTEFHRELRDISSFVIRLSERVLTINPTDPFVTITDCIARYNNLLRLHTKLEEVFEVVSTITNRLEASAILENIDPALNDICTTLVEDFERLRLANNTLVIVMRHLEGVLRENNPAFVFLTPQWFES